MHHTQLAAEIRPRTFDEMVGQSALVGPDGVLRRMLAAGRVTNLIFFGPPGTGKTTTAEIVARESGMTFRKLNATTASLADVKAILSETSNVFGAGGVLLYLDEIQYFNKKQQQSLLEYIEDGRITLIASTTENPHFSVYNALISRCSLFEFKPVRAEECLPALRRAVETLNKTLNLQKNVADDTLTEYARRTGGDVRRAVVLTENAYFAADTELLPEHADLFDTGIGNFDDDTHFDLLSCLQKSVRGSDPDAAVFYLAKLLSLGELPTVCRRLQVMASEDVGLAYPVAVAVTRSCCEAALTLGMPEARIPLANATILLATAPKSNSAEAAVDAAMRDVEAGKGQTVPEILQSPLFRGYEYPHDYPDHWVKQTYLPSDCTGGYYAPGQNKTEQAAAAYWKQVKGE